jgi:hypothetical protein
MLVWQDFSRGIVPKFVPVPEFFYSNVTIKLSNIFGAILFVPMPFQKE